MSKFYKYKNTIASSEELIEVLKKDGIVEEQKDWETVIYKKMIKYKPSTFIELAKKFIETKPIDIVQASENLWGAAASAVKLFYLQCGLDLESHKARNVFVEFTADMLLLNKGKDYYQFIKSWEYANECHSHWYEQDRINERVIIDRIKMVTNFVEAFDKWKAADIINDVQNAISSSENLELMVEKINYEKSFAGKEHHVNYKLY